MVSNLERYKKDLNKLIEKGWELLHSLQKEYTPERQQGGLETDLKNPSNFL